MKKITMLIVLGFLCLNFYAYSQTTLKEPGLKVGDTVPDVLLVKMINYQSNSAHLSDFKGKLLILDFWATWCSPCITMIPKLDSLSLAYRGRVNFLSVTYQSEAEVSKLEDNLKTFKKQESHLPSVVDDKVLSGLFPHQFLPHFVWIGADGRVKAITGASEITAHNIDAALSQSSLKLYTKDDKAVKYQRDKPLFLANTTDYKMIYQSVFTGYRDGLGSGLVILTDTLDGSRRITDRNNSILGLFRTAFRPYGTNDMNRVDLQVAKPEQLDNFQNLRGADYDRWAMKSTYCYELRCPEPLTPKIFEIMQADIKRFFPQYIATIENRKVLSLVLERTKKFKPVVADSTISKTIFGPFGFELINRPISQIVMNMGFMYSSKFKIPIIDNTGYTKGMDVTVKCDVGDIVELNKALAPYGMIFNYKKIKTDILVIRDNLITNKPSQL